MTSRPQMIINVLQANPDEQFTARQLAQKIIDHYSAELAVKRQNPRFASDEDFLSQIAAEVGGSRTVQAKAMCPQVMTRDKPGPDFITGVRKSIMACNKSHLLILLRIRLLRR